MIRKEELTFDSRDGESKIVATKWIPEGEPKCILQIVHGMAEYIDRYDEFARFLAEKGILVVGDDHLGHGRTAKINHAKQGYFCKQDAATVLVRDEHRLKKTVEKEFPHVPYIIMGHSMGSFITRNYLYTYGTGIRAAIICGTGNQPKVLVNAGLLLCRIVGLFCGQKHVFGLLNAAAFGTYNKKIENPKTNVDWVSRNEENLQKYLQDPDCGFTFTVNGFTTLLILVKRLKDIHKVEQMPKTLPILFISGKEDPVGNYGKGVEQVYEQYKNIGMEDVSLKLYENDRHEILNEADRQTVYEDVYNWIEAHLS